MSAPRVLTIAGSDPAGGAGIQADLATFAALRVQGCAAITALTAQTPRGVRAVHPVAADVVREQLEAAFDDAWGDMRAVKTGMLATGEIVRTVARFAHARGAAVLVVDPVLRASDGAELLERTASEALMRELLPLATVVTPNATEAGALLGRAAPRDVSDMRDAAGAIVARGPRWALVKGGHVDAGKDCIDVLTNGTETHEFRVPRVRGVDPHGTGCRLSAAIAAFLAHGAEMPDACRRAQGFVAEWMRGGASRVAVEAG